MKVITCGGTQYGLFIGTGGKFIISSNDCIHGLYENGETASLRVVSGMSKIEHGREYSFSEISAMDEYREFSLPKMLESAEETRVRDFVDYWGIKDRIRQNYRLLLGSMKEISADTSVMPKWGE